MANTILLGLAAICLLVVYKVLAWQRIRAKSYKLGCELPAIYPHLDPIFGVDETISLFNNIRKYNHTNNLERHIRTCGTTFATTSLTSYKWINSAEPRNLEAVFGPKSQDWGVGPARRTQMEPFIGLGFFNCDGAEWDKSRKLVKASLHKDVVNDLEPLKCLMDEAIRQVPKNGSNVDLQVLFEKMLLDSATIFLFGDSMGALTGQSSANAEAFMASVGTGRLGSALRIFFGSLVNQLVNKNWSQACEQSHVLAGKYTDRVIAYREQRRLSAGKSDSKSGDLGVLLERTLLYHMVDQTTDRAYIRGTILQALLAAMDSSAIVLTNIFWLLARHSAVFTTLRTEIFTIAADHDNELSPVALGQMSYLRNVINETLRLYPVIPAINRIALVETILPTGGGKQQTTPIFVPKGTQFRALWHHLHRMPEIWGDDAEEFRPERWDKIKPSPWQFMPFGGGLRRCLGQEKAMLEIAYVVARFLVEFDRIEARDDKPWTEKFSLSAKNLYGCHVGLFAA